MVSQHVSVYTLLLLGKLAECVLPDGAVSAGHAQGTATLAGHAGEALPSAEIIHRHFLKMHLASSHPLFSLQDGGRCWRKRDIHWIHILNFRFGYLGSACV